MLTPTIRKLAIIVTVTFFSTSFWLLAKGNCQERTYSDAEIDIYIKQLKDSKWQVRSQAAYELGKIIQERGTTSKITVELINALKAEREENEVVRLRATFALIEIGLPVVPDLIAELDEREEVRASVIFALRQIGTPAIPDLTEALYNDNRLVHTNAARAIGEIAEDLQNNVDELSRKQLQQAIIKLEGASSVINFRQKPRQGIDPAQLGFKAEDITNIRQSLNALKDNKTNRNLRILFRVVFWIVAIPVLILWFRPDLGLRLTRTVVRLRQKQDIINSTLAQVQHYLNQTGATTNRERKYGLRITSISGKLNSYTPLLVMLATEQPVDRDVTELVQYSARLTRNSQHRAGILLYEEQPDALFRIKMAEVRMRDYFSVIPIPLAAVKQASLENTTSTGLLTDYAERYLPGADLFGDSHAIGDTFSFFGRVELLHSLEENLRRNQGIGLFGLRKSGKTSILLQLSFSMRQHPIVRIDLQAYGGKLRYGGELFQQILQQLAKLAGEKTEKYTSSPFTEERPAAELTAEFVRQVTQLAKLLEKQYQLPILCFLDEVERLIPLSADAPERAREFNAVFGALRALSQEKQVLSLLVADVHPDCNRINQWSQAGVTTNPVFSFFKEVFVSSFFPEETNKMLSSIGQLMGVAFDEETLNAIHCESGGHPFIARQLASLLWKKVATENKGRIEWSVARRYVDKLFTYSGILKDYFGQNIWADLEKRQFAAAMSILRVLSCNQINSQGVTHEALLAKLINGFTESECLDALLWLEAVGLLVRRELEVGDDYQMNVLLLSRWLKMQMKAEEVRQWQIS